MNVPWGAHCFEFFESVDTVGATVLLLLLLLLDELLPFTLDGQ